MTRLFPIDPFQPSAEVLELCGQVLREGEVVLHPTETVYGLAARFDSLQALEKVNRIKGRPGHQPYSILVNSMASIIDLIGYRHAQLEHLLRALFPAPVTVLLPHQNDQLPLPWREISRLGFRYPDHPLSLGLVQHARVPLITTSANRSGQPPPEEFQKISPQVLSSVAVALDGGPTPLRKPSTIIALDPFRWDFEIVREGAFPMEKWKAIWERSI